MERRHNALIPLSHHHYHGLVIALKLHNAHEEKGRWTTEQIWRDSKAFWENGGSDHFREEEEVLFPALEKYCDLENVPEISQALIEHVKIRSLFAQLIKNEDPDPVFLMHKLGLLLKTHIRTEERVIFPFIQKTLPEEALNALSPYFHSYEDIYM